jgi:thiamine-phosphate pyrophosphorylase
MKPKVNYELYLVTDRTVLTDIDLFFSIEKAILGGVTLVQLREKMLTSREFYNTAIKVKKITDNYGIPLIINDRLDIAIAVDAAGVHLGQKDLPADVARSIIGNEKIIGVSTATIEEAVLAEKACADYIGVGALFSTKTKDDTRAVTIELLTQIKQSVTIPVVAIGGITEDNASLLKRSGIDGIAVVSAILGKNDVKEAAKKMKKIISR